MDGTLVKSNKFLSFTRHTKSLNRHASLHAQAPTTAARLMDCCKSKFGQQSRCLTWTRFGRRRRRNLPVASWVKRI